MQFRNFKYTRTKRLANHETETFEATAFLDQGENPDAAFSDLKNFVLEKLDYKVRTQMSVAMDAAKKEVK